MPGDFIIKVDGRFCYVAYNSIINNPEAEQFIVQEKLAQIGINLNGGRFKGIQDNDGSIHVAQQISLTSKEDLKRIKAHLNIK